MDRRRYGWVLVTVRRGGSATVSLGFGIGEARWVMVRRGGSGTVSLGFGNGEARWIDDGKVGFWRW